MRESLARIEDRTVNDLHRIEWAIAYKRGLLERCERKGERELAASLARDIQELEVKAHFHEVARALVLSAL